MPGSSRRAWMSGVGAGLAAASLSLRRAVAAPAQRGACTLSIGTYSLKGMPIEEAISLLAEIGYDGIEIAVQPGFDGEPGRMSADRRKAIRRRLGDRGLALTALMEQITPAQDDAQRRTDLDRLRRVFELARELGAPLVQTVLGGGVWEERKRLYRDRLAGWLDAAKEAEVTLAIKPHRGGAMSRPDEAIWLIRQLGDSPRLRMVYDYSHYAFRDMPLEETVREALPYTAHVAVKDAVRDGDAVKFVLPGASGTFDYPRLLKLLVDGGYRGDVCCEVSSMVSRAPGYEPVAAARACYARMSEAFRAAKVPRESPVAPDNAP